MVDATTGVWSWLIAVLFCLVKALLQNMETSWQYKSPQPVSIYMFFFLCLSEQTAQLHKQVLKTWANYDGLLHSIAFLNKHCKNCIPAVRLKPLEATPPMCITNPCLTLLLQCIYFSGDLFSVMERES